MSWSKKPTHPSKLVKVGDEVDVVVLDIKPSDRRVSLGIKQAQPDPWLLVAEKYPVGTVVTGKVRNIAEFGAFIEIEEGFDGLVHVGDVSWTGRVKNPHEVFKKGEPVTAKVLRIDPENRRVSLGMKQVNDIWGDWFKQHKVGRYRARARFRASPPSARSWSSATTSKGCATTRKSRNASAATKASATSGPAPVR